MRHSHRHADIKTVRRAKGSVDSFTDVGDTLKLADGDWDVLAVRREGGEVTITLKRLNRLVER